MEDNKIFKEALAELSNELEKKSDLKIKAMQDANVLEVKRLTDDIASLKNDKEITQKHLDELTARQKDIKTGPEKQKSFGEQFFDALSTKKDELIAMKTNQNASINFNIKAAGNMTLGVNYTGGTLGLTSFEAGLEPIATRPSFMRQIVNVRPVTNMYVAWAEKTARDGAVTSVAEGGAKPQIDFDIVEVSKKVEKLAGWIKASKEMLQDLPWMGAEIRSELTEQINLLLDTQILSGDGVTPNLKGILTYAATVSVAGTPFALGVDLANNYDVILATAAVVRNRFFNPKYVILNDMDAAMLNVNKVAATGVYLNPPFSSVDGMTIGGLRVITNPAMTAGNFLVGDFTKDVLGIREEININIGYVNADFTNNLVTILGEMRAVNYVKTNNIGAFAKGVFTTVKAAMETP